MLKNKISPCLWFDDRIEEAVNLYLSVFPNSKLKETTRYSDAGPGKPGSILTMIFELEGVEFMALNGGPLFKFTEAVSFSVQCQDQAEVDHYWTKLTANGGEESMCGWLKDPYGLSWQIVPDALPRCLAGPDKAGAKRAMEAMMTMRKIDVAKIEKAYAGK